LIIFSIFYIPQVIDKLHKACLKYDDWKRQNNPYIKPWLFPEQSTLPLLSPSDILAMNNNTCKDESSDDEKNANEDEMSGSGNEY